MCKLSVGVNGEHAVMLIVEKKQVRLIRLMGASTAIIGAMLVTGTASAQSATVTKPAETETRDAASRVDEIVVTAQRREERLQDVPLAASAFGQNQLDRLNIQSTLEVASFVPNLVAQNNTGLGTANGYYLRGVGNVESIATFDTPVGAYIDDVYVARQNSNNFYAFDVDRIEVLRGPQGTLFGRNTSAGSVNLYLRKPADKFTGYVSGGVGAYGAYEVTGNVNIPLSSKIRTKFSAYRRYSDGYVRNVTTGQRLNGDNSWGGRGAVSIDFASNVTWDTAVSYIHDEALNILNTPCSRLVPTQCDGRFSATAIANPLRTPTGRFATTVPVSGAKGGFGLGNVVDNLLVTSDLKIDLGSAKLDLITGFIDTRQHYAIDFFDGRTNAPGYTFAGTPPVPTFSAAQVNPPISNNPNGNFSLTNIGRFEQFSQEIKIAGSAFAGALDYVGGLFYFQERNRTDYADIFGNTLLADRVLGNSVTSYAVYGQVDWHIVPALTATVGLRYTNENKTIDFFDNRPQCAVSQATAGCLSSVNFATTIFPSGATIPLSQTVNRVTPRFAVTYKPDDDFLLFTSATNGFRSGGWNARSSSVTTILPFGPETTWSYELGAKTQFFDNRLRANVTLFYTQIFDLQVLSSFVNPTSGALTFISGNYADQDNKGVEFEFQAVPVRNLTLFANIGIQDPRYVIDRNAPLRSTYNVLSLNAQQQECRAALAGTASPLVADVRPAATRAGAYCGAGIVTPNGDISKVVRSPTLSISGGVSYKLEAGPVGSFTPNVAVSYYSDSETGSSNVNIYQDAAGAYNLRSGTLVFGSHNDPTAVVNASLAWNSIDDRFRVTVACDNCFDTVYVQSALSNFSYINPPRSWTATLRVNF